MTPREKHVFVQQFLLSGKPIGEMLARRQIEEARAVLAYIRTGPPPDLALTDPALFVALRRSITRHALNGWLSIPALARRNLHRHGSEQAAESAHSAANREAQDLRELGVREADDFTDRAAVDAVAKAALRVKDTPEMAELRKQIEHLQARLDALAEAERERCWPGVPPAQNALEAL